MPGSATRRCLSLGGPAGPGAPTLDPTRRVPDSSMGSCSVRNPIILGHCQHNLRSPKGSKFLLARCSLSICAGPQARPHLSPACQVHQFALRKPGLCEMFLDVMGRPYPPQGPRKVWGSCAAPHLIFPLMASRPVRTEGCFSPPGSGWTIAWFWPGMGPTKKMDAAAAKPPLHPSFSFLRSHTRLGLRGYAENNRGFESCKIGVCDRSQAFFMF